MESRNFVEQEDFSLYPVTDFSIFAGFSCLTQADNDRDLDDFVHHDAKQHYEDKIAVTYGLFQKGLDRPLGFATLQNDAISVWTDGSNVFLGALSIYPYTWFPAVKIGRLGIAVEYQRQGLGTLFLDMIICLMTHDNRTGCRFITVDARRDKKRRIDVQKFYLKNGFLPLPCREKTSQYVPMYFDLFRSL